MKTITWIVKPMLLAAGIFGACLLSYYAWDATSRRVVNEVLGERGCVCGPPASADGDTAGIPDRMRSIEVP